MPLLHPEAEREYNRAKTKRWRDTNPIGARRIHIRTNLKRNYGMTLVQYDELFERQNGCCPVCGIELISQTDDSREFLGQPPNEVGRVDHDHETGQIRGILCFGCNVGLGKFRDNAPLLLKAVGYLHESATRQRAQPVAERESASEIEPGNRDLDSSTYRGSRAFQLSPFFD